MSKTTDNKITMGSSIIDLYMDGYDEGKNDDIKVVPATRNAKKNKDVKARASSRRKKSYYKAKGRMQQLNDVGHYIPSPECEKVVFGMLRSHQLPLSESSLSQGISDQKRLETAKQKMAEARYDTEQV